MSMRTYVYTGWGVTDTYLKRVSVERQMAFIKKLLPEVQELMDQEEVTADNFEEWIADYESDGSSIFGFFCGFCGRN